MPSEAIARPRCDRGKHEVPTYWVIVSASRLQIHLLCERTNIQTNIEIVTSFEYQLHPVGPEVMGGKIIYPFEKADEVLRFYRDFAAAASDELGTLAFLKKAPASPIIPEAFHETLVVGIAVCYAGSITGSE